MNLLKIISKRNIDNQHYKKNYKKTIRINDGKKEDNVLSHIKK